MLYDIPGRSAIELETATLVQLAAHPNVVALKDAKLDLEATSQVLRSADLAVYSGQDSWTLPLLAVGAVGVVGTSTHLTAGPTRELVEAFVSGDVVRARQLHEQLLPAYIGVFRTQGTILVKAALNALGLPAGPVRLPLVDATASQLDVLQTDLALAGLSLDAA
jgi:4-hydroxy-tetrahydrodipicolinate synthase